MKIVVTTPTGRVGSRVTQLLVQAGVRPTLLLRDPAKLAPDIHDHVDLAQGDQGDAEFVVRATQGADALFWVDPPTGDDDPAAGYARMGAVAAEAVAANSIGRTVFLSSAGAEKRHGAGEIDGLARTEELLDATGAPVLHLRCGYFFTNLMFGLDELRAGVLHTTWPLDHAMAWVDPRDIGDVAAATLLAGGWTGRRTQGVHGPADLTFAQVAEIVSAAVGKPVRAEPVTDDDVRAGLRAAGLTEAQVEGMVGMSAGLRENFVPEDRRSVHTTTPTTLASWAYEHLRPLF